jgi:hypothetical protein
VALLRKSIVPAIALTAFALLVKFGFAIWVFIPLFPAGFLLVVNLAGNRRKWQPVQTKTEEPKFRKAA